MGNWHDKNKNYYIFPTYKINASVPTRHVSSSHNIKAITPGHITVTWKFGNWPDGEIPNFEKRCCNYPYSPLNQFEEAFIGSLITM